MRTITTHTDVYKFEELSDKAKQTALARPWDVDDEWWDSTYDDANTIGMEITGFDLDRGSYCSADIYAPQKTAQLIIENHGEVCDTYKLAAAFLEEITPKQAKYDKCYDLCGKWGNNRHSGKIYDLRFDLSSEIYDLETEFKKDLCEEYRIILQHEYEDLTSEEAITESIKANDYDGELF
jgi:hypothetical protein